jgi:hypothetical protein
MTNTMPKTTRAYSKNSDGYSECDVCCRCGKYMPNATMFVVTAQGEYPVGADCAKAVRAEGFEIIEG